MPSILNEKPPVEIILKCDKDKKDPPTFLCKRLTMRQTHNLSNVLDRLMENGSADEMFEKVNVAIDEVLVGWFNMGDYVFGETDVADLLTFTEVLELLSETLSKGQMSDEEKN